MPHYGLMKMPSRCCSLLLPYLIINVIILIVILPKCILFSTSTNLPKALRLQTNEKTEKISFTTKGFTSDSVSIKGVHESISMQYFAFPNTFIENREPPFVIYVKSAIQNFERRNAIRNTWALQAYALNVPIVFALGTKFRNGNVNVEREVAEYSDLLWIDFNDTYTNLSFKTLAIVLFHQRLHAQWNVPVLITDDDMIVFVNNLQQLVQSLKTNKAEGHIIGHCWTKAKPVRNPAHK